MNGSLIFDSTSGAIELFVESNGKEIHQAQFETRCIIAGPLLAMVGQNPSQDTAVAVLDQCFAIGEKTFQQIAVSHGLDAWMSLLRRFPEGFIHSVYATLGLLKYSAGEDTSCGMISSDNQFGLAVGYTAHDLLNAFRLAEVSRMMSQIAGTRRWIGKGSRLRPLQENPFYLDTPNDVKMSVNEYERRRPENSLLADEGFLPMAGKRDRSYYFCLLAHPPKPYLFVAGRDIHLRCTFFPVPQDTRGISRLLQGYREPIEDLFDVAPDEIIYFLTALYAQILQTIPQLDKFSASEFSLVSDDGSEDYEHKLGFLYRLCLTGYLRFPPEYLVSRLSEVDSPWTGNQEHRKDVISRFMKAFLVKSDGDKTALDLPALRPLPFLYQSAAGHVYVDLLLVMDFLTWILSRAKEWYGSKHGDVFTLAVKSMIEAATSAQIVDWKAKIMRDDGGEREVDLLVAYAGVLYAIECKAYTKSRSFFRGDPQAVHERNSQITKAVKQAESAANVVMAAMQNGDQLLQGYDRVEWLVCMPSQEYIRPVERFGFIRDKTPRVCTPEELVEVLRNSEEVNER